MYYVSIIRDFFLYINIVFNISKTGHFLDQATMSHWANGDLNGVISIGQWGMFNHEKGAI
jgi:hypothetical protein